MYRQLTFRHRLPGGVWLVLVALAALALTPPSIAQDSSIPMISLEPAAPNPTASVTIEYDVAKKSFTMKSNGGTFTSARWVDIEKRAIGLLPGRTITFARTDGTVLRVIGRTMIGLVVEPVGGALASQVNVADREALVILDIQPGLPAAKGGLLQHDVILEVNGRRPMTLAAFSEIMNAAAPRDVLSVVLMRRGRETEAEVHLVPYDPETINPDPPIIGPTLPGSTDLRRILDQINEAGSTDNVLVGIDPNDDRAIPVRQMSAMPAHNGPNYAQIRAELAGLRERLRRIEAALEVILMLQTQQQTGPGAMNR